MDNVMKEAIEANFYIPDEYKVECDGHAVDVRSSSYGSKKIDLRFWTVDDKEVVIMVTQKEARELRKELKHALALVRIADDI